MRAFQLFLSADTSLGRVDHSLLSDQTLMEILIDGLDDETKQEYRNDDGMYLDVYTWPCITCDDNQRVIQIDMDSSDISGSIQLCYVPPKVKILRIRPPWTDGKLTGSVDLGHLPDGMQHLSLESNSFTGEIDLTKLPDGMQKLSIDNNQLTGEIDLKRLPEGIQRFFLQNNQLTGEIDLTQLPEGMSVLQLQCNQLTGEIVLAHLPDGMESLFLNNNQFTGGIDLAQLPVDMKFLFLQKNQLTGPLVIKNLSPKMGFIDMRGNHFSAVAVVDPEAHALIMLRESGVTSVVDENGREQDMKRFLK